MRLLKLQALMPCEVVNEGVSVYRLAEVQDGEGEAPRKSRASLQKNFKCCGSSSQKLKCLFCSVLWLFWLGFLSGPLLMTKRKFNFFTIGNMMVGISRSMMQLFCRIHNPAHNL